MARLPADGYGAGPGLRQRRHSGITLTARRHGAHDAPFEGAAQLLQGPHCPAVGGLPHVVQARAPELLRDYSAGLAVFVASAAGSDARFDDVTIENGAG